MRSHFGIVRYIAMGIEGGDDNNVTQFPKPDSASEVLRAQRKELERKLQVARDQCLAVEFILDENQRKLTARQTARENARRLAQDQSATFMERREAAKLLEQQPTQDKNAQEDIARLKAGLQGWRITIAELERQLAELRITGEEHGDA